MVVFAAEFNIITPINVTVHTVPGGVAAYVMDTYQYQFTTLWWDAVLVLKEVTVQRQSAWHHVNLGICVLLRMIVL